MRLRQIREVGRTPVYALRARIVPRNDEPFVRAIVVVVPCLARSRFVSQPVCHYHVLAPALPLVWSSAVSCALCAAEVPRRKSHARLARLPRWRSPNSKLMRPSPTSRSSSIGPVSIRTTSSTSLSRKSCVSRSVPSNGTTDAHGSSNSAGRSDAMSACTSALCWALP